MLKRSTSAFLLLAAALLFVPSGALAQTTGRIMGQVLDAQGAALPGATVTVTSPNLQGAQTQVSDSDGNYRFLSLPPGRYTVKVELASFKTFEQNNVEVGLDRTITLPVTLQLAGVSESVTVTGLSPTIDTTSTVTGVNAGADLFERIPLRRDFYAVARVAPGTTEDTVGTVVYGSSSAENQYIIDGLNTTGVEVGDKGKTLNFDFVQEVEVKTGGLPAEYGRMATKRYDEALKAYIASRDAFKAATAGEVLASAASDRRIRDQIDALKDNERNMRASPPRRCRSSRTISPSQAVTR